MILSEEKLCTSARHCYQGKTWWGEICCYKGDSYGEKGSEILLKFVYRKNLIES